MDGRVGPVDILPEQVQVLNPALVLFLIPAFDYIIYPMLGKTFTLDLIVYYCYNKIPSQFLPQISVAF